MRGGRGFGRRIIGIVAIALRTGERYNLRADNGGRAMHFAEVRQRELLEECQSMD